jgi:hypothetical protein
MSGNNSLASSRSGFIPSLSKTLAEWTLTLSRNPLCIDEDMAFSALYLLASVVAALRPRRWSSRTGCPRYPRGAEDTVLGEPEGAPVLQR